MMDDDSREAAWVHAYLHRVEGDLPNAGYWYRTAGSRFATGALEAEWGGDRGGLLGASRPRWTASYDSRSFVGGVVGEAIGGRFRVASDLLLAAHLAAGEDEEAGRERENATRERPIRPRRGAVGVVVVSHDLLR